MNAQELKNVSDATLKGKAIRDLVNGSAFGGLHQVATMKLGANPTDADEFSISGLAADETYEIHLIATDVGTNCNAEMAASTTLQTFTTKAAHNLAVGAVILIGTEFMKVTAVPDTTTLTVIRGYAGSTAANHADDQDIFEAAQAPGAGNVAIPVTSLTVATMDDQLVAGFNALQGNDVTATLSGAGLITLSRVDDGNTGTLAETFTSGSNTLEAAFRSGVEAGQNKVSHVSRVPTAAEVTNGAVTLVFPFAVTHAQVSIVATATNAALAWDGAITISGNAVTLDNSGNADWDADDTLRVTAYG